jgi:hypothetical protein
MDPIENLLVEATTFESGLASIFCGGKAIKMPFAKTGIVNGQHTTMVQKLGP